MTTKSVPSIEDVYVKYQKLRDKHKALRAELKIQEEMTETFYEEILSLKEKINQIAQIARIALKSEVL